MAGCHPALSGNQSWCRIQSFYTAQVLVATKKTEGTVTSDDKVTLKNSTKTSGNTNDSDLKSSAVQSDTDSKRQNVKKKQSDTKSVADVTSKKKSKKSMSSTQATSDITDSGVMKTSKKPRKSAASTPVTSDIAESGVVTTSKKSSTPVTSNIPDSGVITTPKKSKKNMSTSKVSLSDITESGTVAVSKKLKKGPSSTQVTPDIKVDENGNIIMSRVGLKESPKKASKENSEKDIKSKSVDKDNLGEETIKESRLSAEEVAENVLSKSSFQCPHCPTRADSANLLRKHLSQAHEVYMPYKCSNCPEKFFSFGDLRNHLRAMHPEVKVPYINPFIILPERPKKKNEKSKKSVKNVTQIKTNSGEANETMGCVESPKNVPSSGSVKRSGVKSSSGSGGISKVDKLHVDDHLLNPADNEISDVPIKKAAVKNDRESTNDKTSPLEDLCKPTQGSGAKAVQAKEKIDSDDPPKREPEKLKEKAENMLNETKSRIISFFDKWK